MFEHSQKLRFNNVLILFQLQLRDKNERLQQKLEMLQGKFGTLANNKTDLSAQLIMTEEEKLKVGQCHPPSILFLNLLFLSFLCW